MCKEVEERRHVPLAQSFDNDSKDFIEDFLDLVLVHFDVLSFNKFLSMVVNKIHNDV